MEGRGGGQEEHNPVCSFQSVNRQPIAIMASSPSLIVMATLIWSLFAILGLASKTHKSAQRACYGLKASSAETQTSGDEYDEAKGHCWNAASEDDTPACVAFPTNAKQVSEIVQVLQEYTDVEFAMRSGGHNQNRGFSSVDCGVLISSNKLASTTYNSYSDCRWFVFFFPSQTISGAAEYFLSVFANPETNSLSLVSY